MVTCSVYTFMHTYIWGLLLHIDLQYTGSWTPINHMFYCKMRHKRLAHRIICVLRAGGFGQDTNQTIDVNQNQSPQEKNAATLNHKQ